MSNLRGRWPLAAALLITLYGALLRLDAFTGKYGTLDRPAWARLVTEDVAPLAARLRPSSIHWNRVPQPYVGGDPIAYLKYAREMTSFYQPHVREPVFLAAVRGALWALGGQDAAVSLASIAGSLLAIFATYLLGASVISRAGGLAGAALMAIEYENITWAVDGCRDDLFTGMFVLTVWAVLRFRDRATFGNAVILGLAAGTACLTRITAMSFVAPGLLWIAVSLGRARAAYLATAIVIMTAAVAPFLISCAIGAGDPLFAINHHTAYYRFAEGVRDNSHLSATAYIREKIAAHPIGMLDIGSTGLFVRPFERKWSGLELWLPAIGWFFCRAALVGLAIWIFSSRGRLTLLMLLTSLVPYAFTWNLGGGGEWRFTMHVYPIYLLAAVQACVSAWPVIRHRWALPIPPLTLARRAAAVVTVFVAAAAVHLSLPWFVAREALANAEAVTISAGERDRLFYRKGWSQPRADGNVTARVSEAEQTAVHFPLMQKRTYDVILRMDPVLPEVQQRVTVLFNRQLMGRLQMSWDPQRVGSYRLSLPVEWVRRGGNEITLVPEAMVAAGSAGPRFAWLDPAKKVGVRFWYLRVLEP